jgi:hypothetical protein
VVEWGPTDIDLDYGFLLAHSKAMANAVHENKLEKKKDCELVAHFFPQANSGL